ncbi:hypothetical protein [Candidatus Vidania fulgoroideorum]
MKYFSTRNKKKFSFIQILENNFPKDGGLFLPTYFPKFKKLRSSFKNTLKEVFKLYMKKCEYKKLNISNICNKVLCKKNFPLDENIIRMSIINKNISLLKLSNGKTFSFKDIAICVLSKLIKSGIVFCATSGDTGGSCAEFFKKSNINTFIFSPNKRISTFQAKQIYSIKEKNIFNLSIKDNFDKCQDLLKELILNNKTVNSINWIRIIIQTSYYIHFIKKRHNLLIPTGNFGNAYSAFVAKKMGANINKIIIITNENDVLFNFFQKGIYDVRRKTKFTNAPSMDISNASNLERLIYEMFKNVSIIKKLFLKLKKVGVFRIKTRLIRKTGIFSYKTNNIQRLKMIKYIFLKKNILLDPHTSSSIILFKKRHNVMVETAKPIKFLKSINEVISGKHIKKHLEKYILPNYGKNKFFLFSSKDKNKIRNFIKSSSKIS